MPGFVESEIFDIVVSPESYKVISYRDSSIKDLIRSVRYGGNHAVTDLMLLFKAKDHPRVLIPELCRLFYKLGWVTGTGGGISLRHGLVKAFHNNNKIHCSALFT